MSYEYNVYRELNKGLPKMGARVEIPEGRGRVISLDILKRLAYVDLGEGKIVKAPVPPEGLPKAPQMEPRREQRPDDRRPRPDEGRGRQPGQGRDRDRREPRENRDRNGRRP